MKEEEGEGERRRRQQKKKKRKKSTMTLIRRIPATIIILRRNKNQKKTHNHTEQSKNRGELLQQVFRQPMDSILFKVIEAMPLQTPIVFTHVKPSARRTSTGISAYKMPLRSQVFYPLVPGDADLTMASGEHADQVLAEWGCPHGCQDLLAQMQPNPIGPLLIANAFSHTLVLARSPLVVHILCHKTIPLKG